MIRRLALLLLACLAFWVLLAVPVKHLADDENAWLHSGTAMVLCLIPAAITLVWVSALEHDPFQQSMTLLGATGVRLFVVLMIALVLVKTLPPFDQGRFLIWLAVFYLFTLALEMTLLLRGRPRPDRSV